MTSIRLRVDNYRGVPVPRSLGLALAAAAVLGTAGVASVRDVGAPGWGALVGCLLVFAAGFLDDLVGAGPRGVRNHVRALADGRVTTGLLKAVVAFGAAVVIVALEPARPATVRLAGIVLIAGSANVWNGLDVRPGRALKAFLPAALAFLLFGELWLAPAVLGLFVAALVVLPLDLGERAMLGDGGANLLGAAAGLGLYLVLPGWGVVVAAALAVALNVTAETITLSRTIDAVAPLRWVDRLGRRPEPAS
ncbi:MAG TPA: hypothetical protein VK962_02255 [Actinomycetota bacterium]|jgi:hypothetical protein|nr:hypothetical protein [Actinomycetota bacterium]